MIIPEGGKKAQPSTFSLPKLPRWEFHRTLLIPRSHRCPQKRKFSAMMVASLNCSEWLWDDRDVAGGASQSWCRTLGSTRISMRGGKGAGNSLGLSPRRVGCAGRDQELHKNLASLPRNHSLLLPSPPCTEGKWEQIWAIQRMMKGWIWGCSPSFFPLAAAKS